MGIIYSPICLYKDKRKGVTTSPVQLQGDMTRKVVDSSSVGDKRRWSILGIVVVSVVVHAGLVLVLEDCHVSQRLITPRFSHHTRQQVSLPWHPFPSLCSVAEAKSE